MRNARKVFLLVLVVAMALSVLAATGCKPKKGMLVEEGKLTVGSDLDFPPMEQLGADGTTPEGFDVDLMTAIAKQMGLEVSYLPPQKFDTLLAEVNAKKFDVVASSLTINEERKKEILFSDPYFDSNQSMAMRTGEDYTKPEDLKGKKVGVQSGTTGEAWATENLKPAGAEIVPFSKTSEAFAALEAKNVDAVVNDLPVTAQIVKEKGGAFAVVEEIPTGEQYGFAVAIENAELQAAINKALADLMASGEYQTIYDKWFSTTP